jgi:hypothetical protein
MDQILDDETVRQPTFFKTIDIFQWYKEIFPKIQLDTPDARTRCYVPETTPEKNYAAIEKLIKGFLDEDEIVLLVYQPDFLGRDKSSPGETGKEISSDTEIDLPENSYISFLKEKIARPFTLANEKISSVIEDTYTALTDGVVEISLLTNKRIILKRYLNDAVFLFLSDCFEVGRRVKATTDLKAEWQFETSLNEEPAGVRVRYVARRSKNSFFDIDFGPNSRTIASFLNLAKEPRWIEALNTLSSRMHRTYSGFRTKLLEEYPDDIKEPWLKILVSITCGDKGVDLGGSEELVNQFRALRCSAATRHSILSSFGSNVQLEDLFADFQQKVEPLCDRDRRSLILSLFQALVTFSVASDEIIRPEFRSHLQKFRQAFSIDNAEAALIEKIVLNDHDLSTGKITEEEHRIRAKQLTAGLDKLGISIKAIPIAGSGAILAVLAFTSGFAWVPLTIGGTALAASLFGLKQGEKGINKLSHANQLVKKAKIRHQVAIDALDKERLHVNSCTQEYGRFLLETKVETVGRFLDFIEAISKKHKQKSYEILSEIEITPETVNEYKMSTKEAGDILKGAVSAVGAGVGAAKGAFALVGALGAASTGVGIGSLSGAAATNALLAWFGGGAIAAGGGGMALGTYVIGGMYVAPVVAVGGLVLAGQAEKQLTEAKKYEANVAVAIEKIDTMRDVLKRVVRRIDELRDTVIRLDERANAALDKLDVAIFDIENDAHLEAFLTAGQLVKALAEVMRTRLLTDDGNVSEQSLAVVQKYSVL